MRNSIRKRIIERQWVILLYLALGVIVFKAPIVDLFGFVTSNSSLGYIFTVPLVFAYLVWLRKDRSFSFRGRESLAGPVVLVVAVAMMYVGDATQLRFLFHMSVIVAFIAVALTFLGPRLMLAFLPAFVVLFFMIPLPGNVRQWLAIPLQKFATEVTVFILGILGVPAIQTGNLIEINGIAVAVGEACDGMRLVIPLALVIFAFVFSLPIRSHLRILLILVSVPVALLCNVVRLVPTAIAFGYFPSHANQIHDVGGWMMIPLAIILMSGFIKLLTWLDVSVSRWRLVTA